MTTLQELETLRLERVVLLEQLEKAKGEAKLLTGQIGELDRKVYALIEEENSSQTRLFDRGDTPVLEEKPKGRKGKSKRPGMDPSRVEWSES